MFRWIFLSFAILAIQVQGSEYSDILRNFVSNILRQTTNTTSASSFYLNQLIIFPQSVELIKNSYFNAQKNNVKLCNLELNALISNYTKQAQNISSDCLQKADKTYILKLNSTVEGIISNLEKIVNETKSAYQNCTSFSCRILANANGIYKLNELKDANLMRIKYLSIVALTTFKDDYLLCVDKGIAELLFNVVGDWNTSPSDCRI